MSDAEHPDPEDVTDQLLRFIATDGSFRAVTCINTEVVQEAVRRHELSGLAAVALGRAITAAQLLATLTKGADRVTLQIQADGPLRGVMVDAWANGDVRGHVTEPVLMENHGPGRPRVSRVLGRVGLISIFRDLGLKDLYQGAGTLTMGEIDEDVEAYLRLSEQIPSALGCEVLLDSSGGVIASVGVLIQAMPGTKEQEGDPVREAQHRLRTGVLRRSLEAGERDGAVLAAELVLDYPIRHLSTTSVRFHCPCDKERVSRALLTLGPTELQTIADEQGLAEVTCHFCNTSYRLEKAELLGLVEGLKAKLN